MKTKPVVYILIVAAAALILAMCFSPWAGDSGNLTLVWGSRERAWEPASLGDDLSTFEYTVTLKGPGGTIEETFTGVPSATFDVISGTWNVTIKGTRTVTAAGVGPAPGDYFIMGIEQIEVKAGQKSTEQVTMYNAYEITAWSDFNYINTNYPNATLPTTRPLIFLITNDLEASTKVKITSSGGLNREWFLVSEKNVTIEKATGFNDIFFEIGPYATYPVHLGKPGMIGTITFDNKGQSTSSDLILIMSPATLEMYDGITIKGGNFNTSIGAAVHLNNACSGDAQFIMHGGTISGNVVNGPAPQKGGGVYIDLSNVTGEPHNFIKNGGTISGNLPKDISNLNDY